ncbi:alpha/beta hydrolase fold protein [Beutenbergia cavernae DSM 12333]|uniref:Alpha/beta hydrolase fold protein n=1 Tax=Beutenbergia cavernae (strain ATCC BAA-8 / DSM 12333 / CCUG 43141 / JCM 11478 / NBRC 16432 / NCIMB 13614 / HKI 0122) TaxID=471853 RepID=C5BUX6_BEUC1|nr:alpha/beta hydrolase [Beutenbergia cavernae]ACQ78350.1 alpha/beta hydrolase fold protein [Beutenbergia cavernae DSM 12333]
MSPIGWQEREVTVGERPVFVRLGPEVPGTVPIVHVHGFGVSGVSLMPTAELLADRWTTFVPDLPGHGRSVGWGPGLDIPAIAHGLLGLLDELELERVVLLGNSMGSPVILEVAHEARDRVAGAVLVSPAGGVHNQPLARALRQLGRDAVRENPRMATIVVPDYVRFGLPSTFRLFRELTRFPSLERLLRTPVPTLAVIGTRDPLMPPPWRVREVGRLAPDHVTVVVIEGAAHVVNFSHPAELAHVVASWLDGVEIVDDPEAPGVSRVLRLPRGGRDPAVR